MAASLSFHNLLIQLFCLSNNFNNSMHENLLSYIQAFLGLTGTVIPLTGGGRVQACPDLARSIPLLPWGTGISGFSPSWIMAFPALPCAGLQTLRFFARAFDIIVKWMDRQLSPLSFLPLPQTVLASVSGPLAAFAAHDEYYSLDIYFHMSGGLPAIFQCAPKDLIPSYIISR